MRQKWKIDFRLLGSMETHTKDIEKTDVLKSLLGFCKENNIDLSVEKLQVENAALVSIPFLGEPLHLHQPLVGMWVDSDKKTWLCTQGNAFVVPPETVPSGTPYMPRVGTRVSTWVGRACTEWREGVPHKPQLPDWLLAHIAKCSVWHNPQEPTAGVVVRDENREVVAVVMPMYNGE